VNFANFSFVRFLIFGFLDGFFVFYRLPQLKMLDVSHNSILTIPEEIGTAASLVKYAVFHVHFLP
jgi:hypothetical protein